MVIPQDNYLTATTSKQAQRQPMKRNHKCFQVEMRASPNQAGPHKAHINERLSRDSSASEILRLKKVKKSLENQIVHQIDTKYNDWNLSQKYRPTMLTQMPKTENIWAEFFINEGLDVWVLRDICQHIEGTELRHHSSRKEEHRTKTF